jgi:hypothetical protein
LQASAQRQLQGAIAAVDAKVRAATTALRERFPSDTHNVALRLVGTADALHTVHSDTLHVQLLRRTQQAESARHRAVIGELAVERREHRAGDAAAAPKVGSTLCYSLIMQSDIDKGQAQIVSRLYRSMCDKYVQFGEGELTVPPPAKKKRAGGQKEEAEEEPYVLGEHVIALELTHPSGHVANWEKLNTAISYVVDHYFDYDFYVKVRGSVGRMPGCCDCR